MKAYRTSLEEVEQLQMVVCNGCGKEVPTDKDFGYRADYVSIEKTWGYHSHKDGETVKIDLCEDCFDQLVSRLKLPPR